MNIPLSKNRFFSGLLAILYILGGFIAGGGKDGFIILGFVVLPLACIWFGDAMGGFTGLSTDIWITAPTPGIIICILGWLILLLPLIIAVVCALVKLFETAA